MSPGLRFNQLAGMLVTLLVVFPCADLWEWAESLQAFDQYDSCDVNGHIYPHGAVIAGPTGHNNCIKQTCIDAVVEPAQEGCLDTTESPHICRSHDEVFTHACITYTCTSQNSLIWTRALCLDANGNCRQPGTTFSRWTRGGEFSNNCTCAVYPGVDVFYTCYFDY
ncbi:hypothetical protein BsWGS_03435 [Bradybaena similaris]